MPKIIYQKPLDLKLVLSLRVQSGVLVLEGSPHWIAELRPGVELLMNRFEALGVNMGVDLGRGDIGMAQHLLDNA